MHELKLIVDLLHEGGLKKMHEFISDTAAYGDLVSGPRVIDKHVRNNMKAVLKDIQNGNFANQWINENKQGQVDYKKMMDDDLNHPIEKVGANEKKLINDLFETMYNSNGIGLAAVQVGILKRILALIRSITTF